MTNALSYSLFGLSILIASRIRSRTGVQSRTFSEDSIFIFQDTDDDNNSNRNTSTSSLPELMSRYGSDISLGLNRSKSLAEIGIKLGPLCSSGQILIQVVQSMVIAFTVMGVIYKVIPALKSRKINL
mmetsp:Transcript_25167/g.25372  ORF Transcript_25167/g.25372 Transcript_25167/m.25372 type:complete len:127 (-) Transcript_25167:186-566(-)